MPVKLLDFLLLPILQFLRKFHWNTFNIWRAGRQFYGIDSRNIASCQILVFTKDQQNLNIYQILFIVQCCSMHSIIIIMFAWKLWFKFNFIAIFLILPLLLPFWTTQRKRVLWAKFIQVNFYIFRNYMAGAISASNLIALPITSQEFDGGCSLHHNRTYQIAIN